MYFLATMFSMSEPANHTLEIAMAGVQLCFGGLTFLIRSPDIAFAPGSWGTLSIVAVRGCK
jgi:hypothetical protein